MLYLDDWNNEIRIINKNKPILPKKSSISPTNIQFSYKNGIGDIDRITGKITLKDDSEKPQVYGYYMPDQEGVCVTKEYEPKF